MSFNYTPYPVTLELNTMVQLSTPITNPERQNASQTDGRTDDRQYDAYSRSYYVTVRSAKNGAAREQIRS